MSALVETMVYVKRNERDVPWHKLGTPTPNVMTSVEALELGGLNWNVIQEDAFLSDGTKIPNMVVNIRDKDHSVLGTVTDRYKIVQNKEAFDFTDSLVGNGLTYETAGSLRDGKTIFLLGNMPKTTILGDDVEPYICFTNSHDGTGAIRACLTPVRVVCNNTLNLALNTAKRTWTCKHTGNIQAKLDEAKYTLELADMYIDKLALEADRLANIRVTDDQVLAWCNELFPVAEDDSDCKKRNAEYMKGEIVNCYLAPDIAKFMGTAWGVMNAISDFATHTKPNRETQTYWENNFAKILNGHPIMDYFYDKVNALAPART